MCLYLSINVANLEINLSGTRHNSEAEVLAKWALKSMLV